MADYADRCAAEANAERPPVPLPGARRARPRSALSSRRLARRAVSVKAPLVAREVLAEPPGRGRGGARGTSAPWPWSLSGVVSSPARHDLEGNESRRGLTNSQALGSRVPLSDAGARDRPASRGATFDDLRTLCSASQPFRSDRCF